ncbi:GNAT family N-acetyltransferase [Marinirhabdus gelatinilytica]|uniref:Uncharacterized protein n=1 Tax=Marinirhabdus gelatinilytica TaxID=1703343 RepID=A0A370QMD5_9FLAO|nr:GNAT family N-acetyltransferase [Marinirhabdus gelatinilytica]RDK89190.1 hypothetical protein C8D94_1011071 [Marinirhabdus gelatinilytica]
MTKIEKVDNGNKGRFIIYENDEFAGELKYSRPEKSKFSIDHTAVEKKFAGKGLGKKLVINAVEYARENQLKILPHCSYAKKIIENL